MFRNIHLLELVKGSSFFVTFRICSTISGYLSTFLIIRFLGSNSMGLFVLCNSILQFFVTVSKLGIDRFLLITTAKISLSNDYSQLKLIYFNALKLLVSFSFLGSLILFFGSDFIANKIFNKSELSIPLQIMSLGIFPSVMVCVNSECLKGLKKVKEGLFIIGLCTSLTFAVFLTPSIFLLVKKDSIPQIIYVVSVMISAIISFYFLLPLILKTKSNKIKSSIANNKKDILNNSLPILSINIMGLIVQNMDIFLLGILFSERDISVYSISVKISSVLMIVSEALNSISNAKFVSVFNENKIDEMEKIANYSTRINFLTSLPLLIFILISSPYIMSYLGNDFKGGINLIFLIAIGEFINSLTGSGNIIQMTEKHTDFQKILTLSMLISVLLNILLIPIFGLYGAAFSRIIFIILKNTIQLIYIKKVFGFYSLSFKKKL